jgi:hypothetical protein
VLGGRRRSLTEPLELAVCLLAGLFGHAGGFDLLAQLIDLRVRVLALTELATDGLELLTQHVLPLRLPHLALHLLANLGLDLHGLLGARELCDHPLEARGEIRLFQEALLGGDVDVEVRRHEVREP